MSLLTNNVEIEIAPLIPHDSGAPEINGPAIYGASPGKIFSYAFPVCGERPLRFSLNGTLPEGLCFDSVRGWITGKSETAGTFDVIVRAENRLGSDEKNFRIVLAEHAISLTPLLGWTSWSAYTIHVTAELVLANAHALVEKGLAARGYSYVNIDSAWQGRRLSEQGALQGNEHFPDMKKLVDEIHSLGLKAGIYSSPMVHAWGSTNARLLPGSTGYPLDPAYFQSYFGGCGTVSYEDIDAAQWAEWGFDYLKYDWPSCDAVHSIRMSEALRKTDRDFVYSLTTGCHPGLIDTYKKYGNMYRGCGDTIDTWDRIAENASAGDVWSKHIGPGNWFDMDMLALGRITLGPGSSDFRGTEPHENRLSRNEQIFHMSMWAFFPSPVQISCDLMSLDDFTLSLLSNQEILDLNQDMLGAAAVCVRKDEERDSSGNLIRMTKLYTRRLADGCIALGFFNFGPSAAEISYSSEKPAAVRDLWSRKELGEHSSIMLTIPSHGARILKIRTLN